MRISTCSTCGFQWETGSNGGHSCTDTLEETIACLRAQLVGLNWISVSDDLPGDEHIVLITNARWSEPVIRGYHSDGIWRTDNGYPDTEPPTHWMPLPEPPEESEVQP